MIDCGLANWRDRKLREWQLLLLRFAITREMEDRSAVLALADELDSLGMQWRPAAPSFFLRTSNGVCEAILASGDGGEETALLRFIQRINDPRLRRAFRAAVNLQRATEPQAQEAKDKKGHKRPDLGRKQRDLWKGLSSK